MNKDESIIIKRVRKGRHKHHGGSWKIAFADFATAMMAFFLVLWLTSQTTPEQKLAIAGFFNDPAGFSERASPYVIDMGGSASVNEEEGIGSPLDEEEAKRLDAEEITSIADQIEETRLESLLSELQAKVEQNEMLRRFKEQLIMEITPDGLRIQVVDDSQRPMFASGSSELKYYFEDILLEIAPLIGSVPNKVSISGHTDATPFMRGEDVGNWELSAARANTARRTLLFGGVTDEQVAQVVGYGDSILFDTANPTNPVNRRIDILIMSKRTQNNIERMAGGLDKKVKPAPEASAKRQGDERFNLFDAKKRAGQNELPADQNF
ncbi:flagellar motor protein MotB [Aestuariirhabdus sp. Z084]|uniref:flagellar motor protein MotB n=1 Tax=Aestuariirhabdus haliotis TaxID=2918751 RepID=UPI00201B3687|nr:flagellar motor protein MotB [Aestuariirhabdus haliotis]MCL6415628.1 flagellar motor protein MotB [Aestuariirhabdus haliotis]MCL6419623.1 flagellar motor protein MotB [Aestuariirhabdus haliotis]